MSEMPGNTAGNYVTLHEFMMVSNNKSQIIYDGVSFMMVSNNKKVCTISECDVASIV